MKSCGQCKQGFEVTDGDRAFYGQMNVPEPKLCPACRQQRRLAFRNERTLYKRKCSGTGKAIISIYPPDTPFPVYDQDYFFSDKWDARSYGRDFDFSKPFFQQYWELKQVVPDMLNYSMGNENAEYGNLSSWNKNCYMCFEADNNRDCLYSESAFRCVDTVDCAYAKECELAYECVDVLNCYNVRYCLNSKVCSDAWFLANCIGCKNCFSCVNLMNKEFCFFNEQLTKADYENKIKSLALMSRAFLHEMRAKFLEFAAQFPQRYMHGYNNENSSGDYLNNCKNAEFCFDSSELQDCKFVFNSEHVKDSYDIDSYGGVEGVQRAYECHSVGRGAFNVAFGNSVYQDLSDVWYSDTCAFSKDLFGCISLHHGQYCILNKQYTKEDYFALRARIVEHMKKTGEWGEFFPVKYSPFAYNETTANDYFPLSKEEVLARGWRWSDFVSEVKAEKVLNASDLPDSVALISDEVTNWALRSQQSGKLFKITPQELSFYRKHNLPLPIFHPDERYRRRMDLRNPRVLYAVECGNCGMAIQTTFAPERSEKVFCEKCFQQNVVL